MPRQIEVMGQGMVEFPDSMSDDQILSVLNRERMTYMKNFAPGVDKLGLPDSRTLPIPKNFPRAASMEQEYGRQQEPVKRMLDGAARMTRPGADAKFGGAAEIMRGAGEIALPLAALPLAGAGSIGAVAAMLGRMALGAGVGYAGGQVARSLVPKEQPGLQDFAENAGATAGGVLAGGGSESPKLGAFLKGAAKAAPTAMGRSGPYGMGGVALHAMGHNKSAFVADAIAAAAGLPTVIRGGMAKAAGKPWLGPVFSGILGKNKPQPAAVPGATRQEIQRVRGLMTDDSTAPPTLDIPTQTQTPSGRAAGGIQNQRATPVPKPAEPGLLQQLIAQARELMGATIEQPNPPSQVGIASELPSGRKPGGIQNQTNKPKPAAAPNALRQEIARARGILADAPKPPVALDIPVQTQTPSGRKPGGIFNQDKALTPAELIAADAKSKANIEALKARQAAKQNPRPTPTPTPTSKPTAPSENMASRMAAQDAAGQQRTGLMNEVVAEAEKRGAWNVNAGNKGEMLTKLKQDALIKFAEANNLPMVNLTEPEYNALVTAFNQTKPVHPVSGKPWKISPAGANNSATGYGRDVETTLRHFNNMRLGKK